MKFILINLKNLSEELVSIAMESQKKDFIKYGNQQHETFNNNLPGKPDLFTALPEIPLNKEVFHILQFIQERERRRIAEGLHNEIGQLLYSAQLSLSKVEDEEFSAKSLIVKKEIEKLLAKSIESLRKVSFEIMPPILNDYGLKPALETLCKQACNEELKIEYAVNIEKRYNEEIETGIFRIVQELINNIIKHSYASFASLSITEDSKILNLQIEDNGVGFSPDKKDGLGLSYIKQRIYYLNGQISLFSAPHKGTKINIKILLQ